jgi:hypothetical protein
MDTSAVDAEQRAADPLVANDPSLSGISPGRMRPTRDDDCDLGKTG